MLCSCCSELPATGTCCGVAEGTDRHTILLELACKQYPVTATYSVCCRDLWDQRAKKGHRGLGKPNKRRRMLGAERFNAKRRCIVFTCMFTCLNTRVDVSHVHSFTRTLLSLLLLRAAVFIGAHQHHQRESTYLLEPKSGLLLAQRQTQQFCFSCLYWASGHSHTLQAALHDVHSTQRILTAAACDCFAGEWETERDFVSYVE